MLSLLIAAAVSQGATPPLVIRHVTVISCTGAAPAANQDVVIRDGKIERIVNDGDFKPGGETEVEAKGQFLIPGLWDMHVHGTAVPGFTDIYLANGITGIRDMFDNTPMTFGLRDKINKGQMVGPHIVAAGRIIDGPKPIWVGSIAVSNAEEGRKAVATALDQGSDFLKVYSLLPADGFFAIADESKKRGKPFGGHVPESVTIADASDAGMHSMEHLYGLLRGCSSAFTTPQNVFADRAKGAQLTKLWLSTYDPAKAKALFAKLKKNDSYQVPTLTVLYSISHPTDPRADMQDRFQYMPVWMKTVFAAAPYAHLMKKADIDFQDQIFKRELFLVGEMNKAGVPIMAGTDVMNPYCFPGFSLHDELAWLVKAGLTPMEALQAATRTPAWYLGIQKDFGTIEVGKTADLVLLSANPLVDIHNTTKIEAVVLGGRLMGRAQLDKMMPVVSRKAAALVKVPDYVAGFAKDGD